MVEWRGIRAVAGGAGLMITLGTLYCIGNMSPYYVSYMCAKDDTCSFPTVTKESASYTRLQANIAWVIAMAACGQGSTMYIGSALEVRYGPRFISLLGGLLASLGVYMTSWGAETLFTLILTQGVVFGMGVGLAYSSPLAAGWKWFPDSQGLVTGVIVAGFGMGAFVFNPIQSFYVNPDGLSCEYGCPAEVTDRIPDLMRMLGKFYAIIQVICSVFICAPPDELLRRASTTDNVKSYDSIHTNGEERANTTSSSNENIISPIVSSNDHLKTYEEEEVVIYRGDGHGYSMEQTPARVFRSTDFILLYICFGLCGWGSTFVSAFWKLFGQSPDGAHISSDHFLSSAGAAASVLNAVGRIFWGHMFDLYGFKISAPILLTELGWSATVILCGALSPGISLVLIWSFLGSNMDNI
eukprot:CFRG7865T1